jgi:hypothetical protein
MKIPANTRKILLVAAATFPMAFALRAQETSRLVGPDPSKVGDERTVHSTTEGYLRVYTPEVPVYDDDGLAGWDNVKYRVVPESGGPGRIWFDRRPLALNPGTYDVRILDPGIDAIEPHDQNSYGTIRVSIMPGQTTGVWLNNSDRPHFATPNSLDLVRDAYGDVIGYAEK